jgi:hypothetical protein
LLGDLREQSGRPLLIALVVTLILSACTGGRDASDPPTTTAAPGTREAPETARPGSPTATEPREPIQFAFQRPDEPCPPVTALESLPTGSRAHWLADPSLHENEDNYLAICRYERPEVTEHDEDVVLEDHALITSEITLYSDWEGSPWDGVYPELPVESDRLDDWEVAIWARDDREVWWEGCGSAPCDDGDEPTVRTYRLGLKFFGHVGNLEFYARVSYIAERLPADAESRIVAIFRDLVLAGVGSYGRVR